MLISDWSSDVCSSDLELGHRRIGFISGSSEYSLSQWRIDGWQEAMAKAGLPSEGLCQRGDFGYESGAVAAGALLASAYPPTAIIASSDQMALATLEVARGRWNERGVGKGGVGP